MLEVGKELIVLKELREHIIPLSEEEFTQLKKNLINDGCRDPLIVWQTNVGRLVLVDGHNRYKICQENGIPFKIKKILFGGIEEAKAWMIDNQMGRRNLTPDQLCYYRGLKYLALKKIKGGYANVKSKGQVESPTSLRVAGEFNVSESTIKRDAKFAKGLEIIGDSNPKLKMKILKGEMKVKKSDIQILADAPHPEKLKIRNEADLYNKAKIIREDLLNEIETNLRKIKTKKVESAQKVLNEYEPAFLNKGDRLRKIKGMIISAINKAIDRHDASSIKELKKLIDRLTDELHD